MIMMKRMPMIMMMNPMRQLHTQACDSLEVFCKQRIASTQRAIERVSLIMTTMMMMILVMMMTMILVMIFTGILIVYLI